MLRFKISGEDEYKYAYFIFDNHGTEVKFIPGRNEQSINNKNYRFSAKYAHNKLMTYRLLGFTVQWWEDNKSPVTVELDPQLNVCSAYTDGPGPRHDRDEIRCDDQAVIAQCKAFAEEHKKYLISIDEPMLVQARAAYMSINGSKSYLMGFNSIIEREDLESSADPQHSPDTQETPEVPTRIMQAPKFQSQVKMENGWPDIAIVFCNKGAAVRYIPRVQKAESIIEVQSISVDGYKVSAVYFVIQDQVVILAKYNVCRLFCSATGTELELNVDIFPDLKLVNTFTLAKGIAGIFDDKVVIKECMDLVAKIKEHFIATEDPVLCLARKIFFQQPYNKYEELWSRAFKKLEEMRAANPSNADVKDFIELLVNDLEQGIKSKEKEMLDRKDVFSEELAEVLKGTNLIATGIGNGVSSTLDNEGSSTPKPYNDTHSSVDWLDVIGGFCTYL